MIDWLIDWLTDWLLTDWLTDAEIIDAHTHLLALHTYCVYADCRWCLKYWLSEQSKNYTFTKNETNCRILFASYKWPNEYWEVVTSEKKPMLRQLIKNKSQWPRCWKQMKHDKMICWNGHGVISVHATKNTTSGNKARVLSEPFNTF